MEENVLRSEHISYKKRFSMLWKILLFVFIVVFIVNSIQYAKYKKGQSATIDIIKATIETIDESSAGDLGDRFDDYEEDHDRKSLVRGLYNYFNGDYNYFGYYNYNKYTDTYEHNYNYELQEEFEETRSDLDHEFGELVEEAGYSCYYCSDYLEYYSLVQYTFDLYNSNGNMSWPLLIIASLALILLILNIIYILICKKELLIDEEFITGKKISGKSSKFLLKDVKYVESTRFKGLKLGGTSFKYKINLLKNGEQLKDFLTQTIFKLSKENLNVTHSMNDEAETIKKYKELLDNGVITQDEFEAKKKQLLGL